MICTYVLTALVIIFSLGIVRDTSASGSENPCIDNRKWRLIGGQVAQPGQFPFVASLRNESNGLWGGASILNENWLVTAAHCVEGYSTSNLSVVVGSNLITAGGTPHTLSAILQNPNFNLSSLSAENDIALLRVSSPIIFDDFAQPIEVGTASKNGSATVLGWGLARWGYYPDELQFLPTRVTPQEECHASWDALQDSQVCAVVGEGAGVCCGDSGGPLVAEGKLIGIVSYGVPCALGTPDIYTRVSEFEEWIQENINS